MVNMGIFPQMTYRFNRIPIKPPTGFSVKIQNLIFKFIWIENEN